MLSDLCACVTLAIITVVAVILVILAYYCDQVSKGGTLTKDQSSSLYYLVLFTLVIIFVLWLWLVYSLFVLNINENTLTCK